MIILPAIDLYGGECVRLLRGDYNRMTVYDKHPENVAKAFEKSGAAHIHIVDLEGAKSGGVPNIDTIKKIISATNLSAEVGGGIRSEETVAAYIDAGVSRVILGTAAVENPGFAEKMAATYGGKIAVGVDIKDGFVAVKGWTEKSAYGYEEFFDKLQDMGVETVICTDISKDGAMQGTNLDLYRSLKDKFSMNIIASGGVSSLDDIKSLAEIGVYGAIVGKAYYTGAVTIEDALRAAEV